MECPYCKKEMTHGLIQSRDILTWTEGNEIGAVRADAIQLSQPALLISAADAYYCADCRMVIVPVPEEIVSPLDRMGKKWKEMTARRQEVREERAAQRSEEKKEQEKEKRRKKDPWEMK